MPHPDPVYWYALKDRVCERCGDVCEYCNLRLGYELHHRHYRTFGNERTEDVMLVCIYCHDLIHGYLDSIYVRLGSLANRGDTGLGFTPQWERYLSEAH